MPSLALIKARTAAAFGLDLRGFHAGRDETATLARRCFVWIAVEACGHDVIRTRMELGLSDPGVSEVVGNVRAARRDAPEFRARLDRLSLEIHAEALALAALNIPLPVDPDPARTAAQLLAGGSTAATVSEDALRGLALAFLALAAGHPSSIVQEDHHG